MKSTIRKLVGLLTLRLAVLVPHRITIAVMCLCNRFLTTASQVDSIRKLIQERAPCRLLIFGLGNDSEFYRRINRGGRTVFFEHDKGWLQRMTDRFRRLEAYPVHYRTRVDRWRDYMADPESFATPLPSMVTGVRWDIIFVDAPNGWQDEQPGRMESIHLASQLVGRPGTVFVHDCDREIEDRFSTLYLRSENLREEVGNLRRYDFAAT